MQNVIENILENIFKVCTKRTIFCVDADVIQYIVCYWFIITICYTSMHVWSPIKILFPTVIYFITEKNTSNTT